MNASCRFAVLILAKPRPASLPLPEACLRQREHVDRAAADNRDVLLPVPARIASSGSRCRRRCLGSRCHPQFLAGLRVERPERLIAGGPNEHQTARGHGRTGAAAAAHELLACRQALVQTERRLATRCRRCWHSPRQLSPRRTQGTGSHPPLSGAENVEERSLARWLGLPGRAASNARSDPADSAGAVRPVGDLRSRTGHRVDVELGLLAQPISDRVLRVGVERCPSSDPSPYRPSSRRRFRPEAEWSTSAAHRAPCT